MTLSATEPNGWPAARATGDTVEGVRLAYAELRSITGTVADDDLRQRLSRVERRLAALGGARDGSDGDPTPRTGVELSRREHDVLGIAAIGLTNAEVAARLGLRESTVKSYLASAMAKLDASTRFQAVSAARRLGLLP